MRFKLQKCRLNRVLEAAAFRIANLQSFGLRVWGMYILYAWMNVENVCGVIFFKASVGLTATMLMFLASAWEILREL